jgi:type II secretory pathway pseudopilin PulG
MGDPAPCRPAASEDERMPSRRAVSVIEIVIALVVLGVIAYFAVPRFGAAAQAADESRCVRERLQVLRIAIERYSQDHGSYPGQLTDGVHPAGSPEAVLTQLTQRTTAQGQTSSGHEPLPELGPYLRDGLPSLPASMAGASPALVVLRGGQWPTQYNAQVVGAWIYNCDTGQVVPNLRGVDRAGQSFFTY